MARPTAEKVELKPRGWGHSVLSPPLQPVGPRVRIRFPPALNHRRTGPAASWGFGETAAVPAYIGDGTSGSTRNPFYGETEHAGTPLGRATGAEQIGRIAGTGKHRVARVLDHP